MRILDICERTFPVSRYADPRIPSGNLTTSAVVVVTGFHRHGQPVVGYGFSSIGRFAQSGLIRERFAPRLLAAAEPEITGPDGELDPTKTWDCIPEYLRIIALFKQAGWPRTAFQPHGGHLFSLHLAGALGLGGSEANPQIFQPFGGFSDTAVVESGFLNLPDAPGIGFETRAELKALFAYL